MTLKDLRKKKGMFAHKIAEHLEISYRQYHRIELCMAKLDKAKAEKLSEVYDVDVVKIEEAWKEGGRKRENIN